MYQSHNFQDNQKPGGRKLQPKLKIGQPGDKYEIEADAVADRVMRFSNTEFMQMQPEDEEEESIQMIPEEQATVQMKCRECEEDEMLQPKSGNGESFLNRNISSQLQSSFGTGSTLSSDTNLYMSNAFGTDFSGVRVHTGTDAVRMNRQLRARAFTHGENIYFNSGEYNPGSSEGKRLLAHELTHTIQQTKSLNSDGNDTIFRDTEDGTPSVTRTLTNPRFVGNRVLERILSGRIQVLSSSHNGRRGAVSIVQQALVDLGFELPMHLVDGNYGAETEEALSQFRSRYGPSQGNQLDGATLAILDRVAPLPGVRQEHTVDYNRLLEDGRLDVTVAIGATDTTVKHQTGTNRYEDTGRPTEELMAERFREWMQGQGFEFELFGWSGNEYWKATRTFTWTNSEGRQESRDIDIWINLVVPGEGVASEFSQGLSQDEITIYTGHARYGSGPDFDAKASPTENFRIGIDTALQTAGRRTTVEEARHHGVAIDEENDLLEMTRSGDFDPNRYRVLFFNACTSLAYLDEIREHVGNPENTDVIATRRPSMFSTLDSAVGLQETQRFLEGIFASESIESVLTGLNEMQRQRHGSTPFPRGGVYSSSGFGDNPLSH
jgi:peptidoglycan hydrolase-like protein with peptidoglycan-binding domain